MTKTDDSAAQDGAGQANKGEAGEGSQTAGKAAQGGRPAVTKAERSRRLARLHAAKAAQRK